MKSISAPAVFLILSLSCLNVQATTDITGSKDHPLITRYPGSTIQYYEEQKFKPYSIATGPVTGYKQISKWVTAEGKFTRIYYVVSGKVTIDEVYQNYLTALKKGNFKILAQGINAERNVGKEIGGSVFLKTFYEKNPFPTNSNISITSGSSTSGGTCYIAAQLEGTGGNVYAVIGGSQYKTEEKVFLLDIIEEATMENDLIKVNAADMIKAIKANGKIALYGIYFDFDKSDIKPESNEALGEIAKLLTENPSLRLYIVGHTDIKGNKEYNMLLSGKRASAVVNELVTGHNISQSRLSGEGVGPLAPVASNNTEEGRKLNRRVELVARD